MCGFVGIVSVEQINNKDVSFITKGLQKIISRGPNNQKIIFEENYALGHNRLKIIDYSDKSDQPLISNDGKNILVFNGEIYNYKLLRKELENLYSFTSNGDGEVLLAGLSIYGLDFLSKCNGMYSFAFLRKDNNNRVASLIISRDSFGQKPLFYSINRNSVCFSSTIESLPLDYSRFNFDEYSIAKYFQYGYVPAPLTVIEGVNSVLPGFVYEFKFKGEFIKEECALITKKYESDLHNKSYESLFNSSLEQTLESDASLGLAFSSGRDSVQIACGLAALGRKDIPLFNVSSYDSKFSETKRAKKIATSLGLPFYSINPSEINIFDEIDDLYYPFADSSYLMSKTLFKSASNIACVVISGDGGDEIHCSYPHYKNIKNNNISSIRDFFVHSSSKLLEKTFSRYLPYKYKKFISYFSEVSMDPLNIIRKPFFSPYDFKQNILLEHSQFNAEHLLSDLVKSYKNFNDIIKSRQNWDQYFHFSNCLAAKTDLASMNYSIEARSPYLNSFFKEGLYNLFTPEQLAAKPKYLQDQYISKFINKNLMSPRKQGFEFGLKRKMIEMDAEDLISRIEVLPWLKKDALLNLIKLLKSGESTQEMIYSIMVMSSVFKNFSKLGVKTNAN